MVEPSWRAIPFNAAVHPCALPMSCFVPAEFQNMSSGQRSGQCAIRHRNARRTSMVSTLPLPDLAAAERRMSSDSSMMIR